LRENYIFQQTYAEEENTFMIVCKRKIKKFIISMQYFLILSNLEWVRLLFSGG